MLTTLGERHDKHRTRENSVEMTAALQAKDLSRMVEMERCGKN